MQRAAAWFGGFLLVACASGAGPPRQAPIAPQVAPAVDAPRAATPREPWPPADAASGVSDPQVADLLRRHWALTLELFPELATNLGVHRFDDRLEDNSPEGLARQRAV